MASVPPGQLQREVLGVGLEAEAVGQGCGEGGKHEAAAEREERVEANGGQQQGPAAAERHGECALC